MTSQELNRRIGIVHSVGIDVGSKIHVKRIRDVNLLLRLISSLGPSIFKVLSKTTVLLRILEQAGDVSRFLLWQYSEFRELKIYVTKKSHFKRVIEEAKSSNKLFEVFEFGVAHGYTTSYFLNSDKKAPGYISTYRGFDTFLGLPSGYRGFKAGSFSNNGKFPDLESPKLFWHKGLVENTVNPDLFTVQPKLVIFDLDLHDPTLHVFNCLKTKLRKGDILYFDEAFDDGEFQIVKHEVLSNFKVEYLGTNGQSLALKIVERVK